MSRLYTCKLIYAYVYIFIICIVKYISWYRDIVDATPGKCCAPITLGQPECGLDNQVSWWPWNFAVPKFHREKP